MVNRFLYSIGNLYTGYPWGVEAERQFGTVEIHGAFSSENEANTYMHRLVENDETGHYVSAKIVRLEAPQAGKRIVRSYDSGDTRWEYAV